MSDDLRTLEGDERPVGKAMPPIECFRCGICCQCYTPQLSPEEAARIANRMGISINDFISKYVHLTAVGYLLRQKNGDCIFLDWEGVRTSCRIHAFRPDACRDWVPGLERRECREGLARMKENGRINSPGELYSSVEAAKKFSDPVSGDKMKKNKRKHD